MTPAFSLRFMQPSNKLFQDPGYSCWRRTLFAIFFGALLVRIVFILTLQDGYYFADGYIYSDAASHLREYGEFPEEFDRAPLYPLFLAAVYSVAREDINYPRIVQAVLGAVIAVLIAVIGRVAGGFGVGAVAGILWGIYPLGVFIAGIIYPTTLLTILLACGVLCLVTGPDARGYPLRIALAGLLFGMGALTKPIVLGTIVFVTLWIFFWRRSNRYFLASLFLMTAVITLLPWTVRNFYVYDRLVPIEARGLEEVVPWADVPAAHDDQGSGDAPWAKIRRIARRFPNELGGYP